MKSFHGKKGRLMVI